MRDMVRLGAILGIICLIAASALSAVDGLTKDRIEAAQAEILSKALASVLPGDREFTSSEELLERVPEGSSVAEVFVAGTPQAADGLAFKLSPAGYAGPIDMIVGIDSTGTITGVQIVSQSETPGLGAQISREKFWSQFARIASSYGKDQYESVLQVKQDGGQVDAVTGATISSRAVTKGVRQAHEAFETLIASGALTLHGHTADSADGTIDNAGEGSK